MYASVKQFHFKNKTNNEILKNCFQESLNNNNDIISDQLYEKLGKET